MNRTIVTTPIATAALAGVAALGVAAPAVAGADVFRTIGTVTTYEALMDAEAKVQSVALPGGGGKVLLTVTGLLPGETYGAHLHVNPCEHPNAAGAHYQRVVDPALGTVGADGKPVIASTDPAYANADNEVWLDMTADADGSGHAKATKTWQFDPQRPPGSVIIHRDHTSIGGPNQPAAGSAGPRLGCLTLQY